MRERNLRLFGMIFGVLLALAVVHSARGLSERDASAAAVSGPVSETVATMPGTVIE